MKQTPTIKNPPVPPPAKKSLNDAGTRYRHLEDLHHFWQDGIEAIKAGYRKPETWSEPKLSNMHPTDATRITRLELCVEYLKKYTDILSERDTSSYKLGQVVDSIPRLPKEPEPKPKSPNEDPPLELTSA